MGNDGGEFSRLSHRLSVQLLATIVETIPDTIFVKDADNLRYVLLNKAGEEMLGVPREELLGRTDHDLFGRGQADSAVARDREVLTRRTTVETEDEEILNSKKGLRVLHSKRCLIEDETGPRYILGIFRDITDSKAAARERDQLERQLQEAQKMEAIGLLAGSIAHDFNNMLTVMLAAGQVLLETLDSASPEYRDAEDIVASVHRASALTRQLLAFSRRQVLQPRVLDVNAILANIERLMRRLLDGEINLIIVPVRDVWPVRADASQLEQVIINLAINARDAMPEGGTLTFATANTLLDEAFARAHPGTAVGPHVMLSVSDTGIGMSAEVKAHLFEPFFTTKKPGRGTGLGLSTVYGIVRQSGGYIYAESELGRGTTFRIFLPRASVDESPDHDVLPTAPLYGNETILVIEDDAALRELEVVVLRRYGYSVLAAPDFDTAMGLVEQRKTALELVVTDALPYAGGRLPGELTNLHPDGRVLYVSSHGVVDGVLAPRVSVLRKPFTPVSFAEAVREALDRS